MKIGLMGDPGFCDNIYKVLSPSFEVEIIKEPTDKKKYIKDLVLFIRRVKQVDILCNVFYGNYTFIYILIAKLLKKKFVNYWLGTDVFLFCNNRYLFHPVRQVDKHIACSPLLKKELAQSGVDSTCLRIIPVDVSLSLMDMPESHAVLAYIPNGREEFYGYDILSKIIDRYSETLFYIVGNDNDSLFKQKNAKVMGMLSPGEMEAVYGNTSILLRHTQHDGSPVMIMEALAKGREVIFNHENIYEHIHYAPDYTAVCNALDEILRNPPELNVNGHDYIEANYRKEAFVNDFKTIIDSLK